MRKDLLPGKKWIKSRYNMIQFLLKVNFSFWFYSAYSTRWEEIFSPGRSGWKANRTWSNWSSCINRINKGADKALSAYQLHNERILLGQVVLRFYIIKCVSLFTFYRFQAIKCARRQPSTFYGIEIGKKEIMIHILL